MNIERFNVGDLVCLNQSWFLPHKFGTNFGLSILKIKSGAKGIVVASSDDLCQHSVKVLIIDDGLNVVYDLPVTLLEKLTDM